MMGKLNWLKRKTKTCSKSPIVGKRVNGTIVIDPLQRDLLHPGQKVLVVKDTESPIFSRITGEEIGTQECIIGRGKISFDGSKVSVVLDASPKYRLRQGGRAITMQNQGRPPRRQVEARTGIRIKSATTPSEERVIIQPILD